jgi:hypothetical protein
VNVKVAATNTSSVPVYLDFIDWYARAGLTYRVTVRDEQGNVPPDTRLSRVIKYNRSGSTNLPPEPLLIKSTAIPLNPGETFTDTLDVSMVYDFSQPEKYTVQIDRLSAGDQIEAKSNTITINVIPGQNPRQASSSPAQPSFSLAITALPGGSVPRGSQVGLKIVTHNTSDHTITLWADKAQNRQGNSTYQLKIRAADGSSPADTPLGSQQKARADVPHGAGYSMASPAGGDKLALQSGQTWSDTVMLNEFYNLSQPGKYAIQATRFDPETGNMVESNSITLEVLP